MMHLVPGNFSVSFLQKDLGLRITQCMRTIVGNGVSNLFNSDRARLGDAVTTPVMGIASVWIPAW